MKILASLAVVIGIVATVIAFFNFNLAIDILVKSIIVACFVGLLLSVVFGGRQ